MFFWSYPMSRRRIPSGREFRPRKHWSTTRPISVPTLVEVGFRLATGKPEHLGDCEWVTANFIRLSRCASRYRKQSTTWSSTIPIACIYAYTTARSTKLNPQFTLRCPPVSADKTPRIRIKMPSASRRFAVGRAPRRAHHSEEPRRNWRSRQPCACLYRLQFETKGTNLAGVDPETSAVTILFPPPLPRCYPADIEGVIPGAGKRYTSRKLGRMESDGIGAADDLLTGGIGL
jgi:hypothetical protein